MLDDLLGVIELLKERISTHGQALRQNETRNRIALIDPLLRALGWDTSDPAIVMTEFQILAGRADYAFLATNGKPVSVLEAKKLGQGLETHNSQMINYALQEGVDFAGLTDGDRWHIYDLSKSGALPNRQVLNVSISDTPAYEAALKLLLLWRSNLSSGQPVAANAPAFEGLSGDESTVAPIPPVPTPDLLGPSNWISLSKFEAENGKKPPAEIRFSLEECLPIRYWWEVLAEVAEKLAKDGKLTVAHCPITGLGFINSSTPNPESTEGMRHGRSDQR